VYKVFVYQRLVSLLRRHQRLRWLPPASVLVVALGLVWPLFSATPLSHDHPVHLFKAWLFWTEMLGRGRLRGWSHFWSFGFPYGELTPMGPELWVALFRVLTLGLLSWLRTYSVAFAGMFVFAALSCYRFAKHFFGRWAGALAALLFMFDLGGWAQGGWLWHSDFGVWPVTLAMSFTLLALVQVDCILAGKSGRHGLWVALLVAASMIVHQVPLIAYALAVPLLVMDRATGRSDLPRGAVRRLAMALGLGVALPAFYVVPMLARGEVTLDLGLLWLPFNEVVQRLVDFRSFDNMMALTSVAGVVGIVLVLRERRAGGLFFAAAALGFVLLSSNALIEDLHAERVMKGLLKIETQRMLLLAKLFWLPLAAHALVSVLSAPPLTPAPPWWPKRAARLGVLLIVALPVLQPAFKHINETQLRKHYQTESETKFWAELQPFFVWSSAERRTSDQYYRIAYDLPFHDHLSTIAPVFNDTPSYKVGYTPAQQFRSFPMSHESELYEALSIKYVLSDHPLAQPDFLFERDFGALTLYRFAKYRPLPFSMLGPGEADLVRFEPERIEIRLNHTAPDSRLKIHVAHYDRWRATLNGSPISIQSATVQGNEYPFLMELAAGDGLLELRYVRRAADWLGLFISLGALWLLIVVIAAKRTVGFPLFASATVWLDGRSRQLRWLGLGGVAILALVVVARAATPRGLLPANSLFRSLPAQAMSLDNMPCRETGPLAWQCGLHELRATVANGIYGHHICMSTTDARRLVLDTAGLVRPFIDGRYDTASSLPGHIHVGVNGATIGDMDTRSAEHGLQMLRFDARPYLKPGPNSLHIEVSGAALHCFDFLSVPLAD